LIVLSAKAGTLKIDGKPRGRVKANKARQIAIKPGAHNVVVEAAGKTFKRKIKAAGGKRMMLNLGKSKRVRKARKAKRRRARRKGRSRDKSKARRKARRRKSKDD